MSEPTGIEARIEAALVAGLADAGAKDPDVFVDFFRVANPREARFPQVSGGISMPVPDGTEVSSWAEFRKASGLITWATVCFEDQDRAKFIALERAVIQMLATANAQRHAWKTAELGDNVRVDACIPTDAGTGIPEVETLPNGCNLFVGSISFDLHVSVTQTTEEGE